ncbi:unnamed protein product [Rhizophagus irregularis]|uniref:Uncharacterized protein n=1 Tax=Rhizophagus irregularis TaxID=588596 RepID=A0A916E8N3_9GLOM|nr:unnamed protein product [Rhizophagus irregularis]
MEQTPETELRPIYKPTSKYNLQDALGLKNEKQRWLAYLEIMRECLYEKNVDFTADYRSQKHTITAQIVRSFKKKAPDFPITAADWAVKEMLVSTIQNKRYYLKKKKNELENNLRVPPQNSPALQDCPPPSPQAQQDPPSPVEPSDEQVQIRPPVEPSDEQVQIRPPEPRTDEQVQMVHKRSQNKLQERKNKSFSNNKRKRDKVNSLNETIENKDKEITQLKRQKTFASKRGSARQVVADYIKELEKKVQELQEQVNGMDWAYRDDQRELLRVHNELKKAERKITRLEGEERDEEGQERRQRRGQGRGKRGNVVLQKSILPYNFDSGEQPETEQPATDKQEPLVLIISPSVTSDDSSSGSPSVGVGVSETFSNNGTKKPNINNEFDNDDRNEEQDHGQDDQVKVLDTNTDDANEDFCSTQKNDKKRTKIDTSMRKRAKPDEKILLAINKIGGPTIDSNISDKAKSR